MCVCVRPLWACVPPPLPHTPTSFFLLVLEYVAPFRSCFGRCGFDDDCGAEDCDAKGIH